MAQTVNVIGYGPITFPDGMSREQIAEALKKLPPLPGAGTPATPAAPQTVMDKLASSPVGGVVRGCVMSLRALFNLLEGAQSSCLSLARLCSQHVKCLNKA